MKQFRVVAEADRNYPMGFTIDGKRIHASVKWPGSACSLVLTEEQGETAVFEMSPELCQGDVWNLTLETDRQIRGQFIYGFQTEDGWLSDPYGREFRGREIWGAETDLEMSPQKNPETVMERKMEAIAGQTVFDWGEDRRPQIPYEDCVIYKAHVRGFTKHPSSHVRDRGTFRAVMEKIPYMKELGVTTLELMPATEFCEVREEAEMRMVRGQSHDGSPFHNGSRAALERNRKQRAEQEVTPAEKAQQATGNNCKSIVDNQSLKLNYWGYGDSFLFAPKASYSSGRRKHPVTELKTLVRELHKNHMELVLELYVSGKEDPSMVLDAVRYWAREYHIDGIHLVGDAPLKLIGQDPYLSRLKLWAEYWNGVDEGIHRHLGWYNDGFLRDMRQVLKGDDGSLNRLAYRAKLNREDSAVINYMAGTNGFTLADMVSYDEKHNEANGERGKDGPEENDSWNCGAEGPTRKKKVLELRKKQMKNAVLMLFCSQGTPMFLAGDEFGNSQSGNNNPYCQDNEITWLNWNQQKTNGEFYRFVKDAIAFRKAHPVFHQAKPLLGMDSLGCGQPDISCHGVKAWQPDFSDGCHQLSIMYCGEYGRKADGTRDEDFLVIYNMHWEPHQFALPKLSKGRRWHLVVDTGRKESENFQENGNEPMLEEQRTYEVEPRSIVVLMGKMHPELEEELKVRKTQRKKHRKPQNQKNRS